MNVNNLSFKYANNLIINNLSYQFIEGKITTIIGPNGCGKSTKNKDYAKKVAIVYQNNQLYENIKVKDLIKLGRSPYHSLFQELNEKDHQIINWSINACNINTILDDYVNNLSGGQKQRVWIALALVQESDYLLLDEPITYLDIKYQLEILNLIKELNIKYHKTIIMVHHDINQAASLSDEIVAMKNGQIIFTGKPQDVITSNNLELLYDTKLKIIENNYQRIVINSI